MRVDGPKYSVWRARGKQVVDQHGSYVVDGPKYSVFQGRGNLTYRQQKANMMGCQCWAEQHLNAGPSEAQYAMAICAENASPKSVAWGRSYTRLVAKEFGIRDAGVVKYSGRGAYNVRLVSCPSILLEPGFITHPDFAQVVATGEVLDALARCLVDSIVEHFGAGLVGLSVGHMYRGKPDPGALVAPHPDMDPDFDTEAELNDAIISTAEEMLLSIQERTG